MAGRLKHSLTSLVHRRAGGMNTLPAECLLQLVNDSRRACHLKHKCQGTLSLRQTWKTRFVILAKTAIYVYDDRTSDIPRGCIPLLGYNSVCRVPADKSCKFAFAVSSEDEALPPELFDCATEPERREWMAMIRESLCKANHLPPRKLSLEDHLRPQLKQTQSQGEAEYRLLEEPVFSADPLLGRRATDAIRDSWDSHPRDSLFTNEDSDDEDADDDHGGDDDDDDDIFGVDNKRGGHTISSREKDEEEEEDVEVGIWTRLQRKGAVKRRRTSTMRSSSSDKSQD